MEEIFDYICTLDIFWQSKRRKFSKNGTPSYNQGEFLLKPPLETPYSGPFRRGLKRLKRGPKIYFIAPVSALNIKIAAGVNNPLNNLYKINPLRRPSYTQEGCCPLPPFFFFVSPPKNMWQKTTQPPFFFCPLKKGF